MTEKTITICGKDVKIRYCAATETGFEQMSGRGIEVFSPTFGKDKEGNTIIKEKPEAVMDDYLKLGASAIVAAYLKDGKEPPISADEILFEASPQDISTLITEVVNLRNEWYVIPNVVKPEMEEKEGEDEGKNA